MSLQGQNLTEKENDYIKGVHLQLKIDSILCFQDLLSKWKIYLYEILKYPTYRKFVNCTRSISKVFEFT